MGTRTTHKGPKLHGRRDDVKWVHSQNLHPTQNYTSVYTYVPIHSKKREHGFRHNYSDRKRELKVKQRVSGKKKPNVII